MIYEGEPCDARPIWANDTEMVLVTDEDAERGRLEHGWLLCSGTHVVTYTPPADATHRRLECAHFSGHVIARRHCTGIWCQPKNVHTHYILYKYAIDVDETDEVCLYKLEGRPQVNHLVLYGDACLRRARQGEFDELLGVLAVGVSVEAPIHGLYRRPLCSLK